jgi:outer membrane protein OmpA-like peptidoglycan-associated protein
METIVVHFAFDSAELDASGRLVLDAWLLQGGSRDRQIRITGYADRLGPEPYNLLLSKQRAEAVQRYLADKGMKTENLEILALGEQHPVVRCKGGPTPATKACLAPNRRAEISTR